MSVDRRKLLRLLGRTLLVLVVLGVAVGIAAYVVLSSDWAKARARVILEEEITKASGGRAEIASLDYDLGALRVELGGFILHGTEGPDQPALFRASRIVVDATVLSWLGKKFRVESVTVDRPTVHLSVDENGRTNLPKPPGPSTGKPFTHTLIDLGVGHFEIRDGTAVLAQRTAPLDVRGDNLDLTLDFERSSERYLGSLAAQRLQFSTDTIQPVPFDFRARVSLERDRFKMDEGRLSYAESEIRFTATLENFANPRLTLPFTGDIQVKDFHREFRLPVDPVGEAAITGEFRYGDRIWSLDGGVEGTGFAIRSGAVRVSGIGLRSKLALEKDSFVFSELAIQALGGEVRGRAALRNGTALEVQADARELLLDRVSRASGTGPLAFDSRVSGSVSLQSTVGPRGITGTRVEADLDLVETDGENPLSGSVVARYRQADQSIAFEPTTLRLAHSELGVTGNIRDGLQVDARTTRLNDFLPALALVSENPETLLPVQLGAEGMARFRGTIRGTWELPAIDGMITARAVGYEGRTVDEVSAQVKLDGNRVSAHNVVARKGGTELRGAAEIPLTQWKPNRQGLLQAELTLRADGLATLLSEAGQKGVPLRGRPVAEIRVRGTLDAPEAALTASVRDGAAWGEAFDEVQVKATYAGDELRLLESTIRRGEATASLQGSYRHRAGDYASGAGQAAVRLRGLRLSSLAVVRESKAAADGVVSGDATVAFQARNGELVLNAVNGGLETAGIHYEGKTAGQVSVAVKSANEAAALTIRANLAGTAIEGEATVGLRGDYDTTGTFTLRDLTFDSIRPWLPAGLDRRAFPIEGMVSATARVNGPLTTPGQMKGDLVVERLRVATTRNGTQTLERRGEVELRNARPLRFAWDGRSLTAQDVELEGTGTQLTIAGKITPTNPRQQLDLQARGSLSFSILNAIEPTVDAGGRSELDLTVRGTFSAPDVYGLLDLKDASFYLAGVPNGLDEINGRVFLYRDRANIEEIRAESGGGTVTLSGFVSYNQGVPTFRLSARGTDVRVRYPPGVSTSANAALELTGSRNQSILSGSVSVTRVALNPRSDLGSILTNTSKPVATPSASQNDFLRNMRFDVRVQTAPDVRFDSTLTQDLAGEADLRLRGNPYTPVLLGNVTVNQGEVNFFGNRYYIDRGEISFLNPVKMEPVLNLDLRTRVRSIDVTLTFSGPLEKLNVNYRSDPPLQLNEIIALLTVGRAPAGSPSLAQAQNEAAQSWQQIGASALVGQAVAAPIAGRLQKFFGVSRIKIDPRLTGVENNPQARLTVEQQVNRDITVTFITNLADAQQQIVRVEWNLTSEWSMVALRDEDGLFGIDFLFRKRF